MKTLYSFNVSKDLAIKKTTLPFFLFLMSMFFVFGGFSQPCPVPSLSAPAVCQGQQIQLNLSTTPSSSDPYSLIINGVTYNGIVPGTPFNTNGAEDNFFGTTAPTISGFPDTDPYELGVKFNSNTNGLIKGVRFYKDVAVSGPFTGSLWTSSGVQLATGTFSTTASGWQELIFAAPVPITAGVTYVASYYSPNGIYPFLSGRFTTLPVLSPGGYLTAPASGGPDGSNGVYKPGTSGFPTLTFSDANYYVDVIFSPNVVAPVYNLTSITGTVPACNTTGSPLSTVTVTINPLPAGTISSPGNGTAGQPSSIDFNPTAGTGPYSLVINGSTINGITPPTPFSTGVIPSTTSTRIWNSPSLPAPVSFSDGPYEVGMKFRTSIAGSVTALRFYKAIPNTTTTVLNIYSGAGGAPLGTTTYTDPTGNQFGFLEATLPTPVTLTPGNLYVVSYYSPDGNYVANNGFMVSPYSSGPLTVSASGGADGFNGVFVSGPGFPNLPNVSTNYWADVVFFHATSTLPLNLTQITDGNGCSVSVNQLLTLNVDNALPVSLTEFSAVLEQNTNVRLDWKTASESNNKGFEVERSTDAAKWLTVGFVAGSGTSSLSKSYNLVDKNLSSGKYFYRLKQIDFDGKFNFSNILKIDVNGKLAYALNQSYPNPSHGAATITYSVPVKSQVTLTVYDMQGRVVRVLQNGERAAGKYAVTVPSDLLKTGVYYYKLEAGEFKSTRKMIVQ